MMQKPKPGDMDLLVFEYKITRGGQEAFVTHEHARMAPLVAAGWLRKTPNPQDGRMRYQLTLAGCMLVERELREDGER